MDERERIVQQWFHLWLNPAGGAVSSIFTPDAVYIESWGPEYHGCEAIQHWFDEWNTRGQVVRWGIKQFFHKDAQTVVEWYFKNRMNSGAAEAFDGMSLIRWAPEGKICYLQEFGCNKDRYDPYEKGDPPQFREQPANWF
ncbi:nuclear transport factor 2 family protein [Pseudoflavonifractor sp. 524-17]|uniref:nuclear transport factor 2 family protein n=1 Tax=Pseudoflavonifractor sp. 524-17 TaxID=2304577 RepID=UPI00137ADFBF|nr:nuclear transport factor 2 family protein [Pseudoflavonifractor sp. 524-17]NCE66162.1 nuclear transport factor 2 family protein [Pseudoflavonifractor sp. 524-17]